MMSVKRLTTAQDFFVKYGLDQENGSIDKDRATPGIQSDQNGSALVSDYQSLPPAYRYVVFSQLQKRRETEVLENAVNAQYPQPWAQKILQLNSCTETLKNSFLSGQYTSDVWSGRLALLEGIFLASQLMTQLEEISGNGNIPITRLGPVRRSLFENLSELYLLSGRTYWDTDGDFHYYDFETEPSDRYFDDKDSHPLDPLSSYDPDGDLVDEHDPDSFNSALWNRVPRGGKIEGALCDVMHHEDDSYTILLKINLRPASDARDKTQIENAITPDEREKLAKTYEHFYETHREERAKDIALDIQFIDNPREAHAVVEITDDKAWRSNMKKWALADLQNPAIIVHENLHIPGLPDLYNEEYVHGNIRDHTFSPGYILLDPQNIMVRHGPTSIIRAWQMRSIIAKATPGTKLFWKEASHHETLNVGISWEHIARARSDMQHDQPNEELSIVGPRHPWMNPFITSAEDHLRRGEVARGLELMHMAWSSGLSRHDRRQLADLFWAYGYRKETFFLLQEGLEKNPRDSSLLESMAAFSLLSKEPQAAHDYAEQAVQQCDQCLYSNLYLILSLFELGQIKEAKETYTRATEKIHSARQKELREETTRYLIRKGNIAEAEEIYMDESWHDDGTKWRFRSEE